jgi:thiol-disulfide isomerase/thioredoxin
MGDDPLDGRGRVPGVMTKERFEQGMTLPQYIDHMSVNRERFVEALDETTIGPEDARVLAQLGAVRRVLVLSEDWCGTCLAHVPYVARLVEGNASIEMRLFPRDANLDVMDQYLKKGLYRSIPVFVFFDEHMNEVARFIETRPA